MKRNPVPALLALTLALTAAAPVAFAQAAIDPAAQNQVQTRRGHMHDPHKAAMHLSKKLGLSADQTAKLEPILADRQQKVQAVRAGTSLTADQRHVQMHAIAKNTREQLAGVLTPEQLNQWKSMRKDRRRDGQSGPVGA